MALSGKWELVRNEGLLEHLTANGVPEDRAKIFVEGAKVAEITISGDDVTISRGKGPSEKLKLNQESSETRPDGEVVKCTATLKGDSLSIVTEGNKGKIYRTYTSAGSELTMIAKSESSYVPDGKIVYKRA